MIAVNFIPAQHRARQRVRRRRAAWFKLLRAYALLLTVGCGLAFLPARAAAPSLESAITRLDRRIEVSSKALRELKQKSSVLTKQIEVARLVGEHPDWSALLDAVADTRNGEAALESFDLVAVKPEEKPAKAATPAPSPAPATPGAPAAPVAAKVPKATIARDSFLLKLTGACPTLAACLQFAQNLEALDIFERVTVKETHPVQIGQMSAMHFEIEATISSTPKQIPVQPATPPPVVPSSAAASPAPPTPATGAPE